jgi:hypothetical protein
MRSAGHDDATTADCAAWICRFILFHHKRHPRDMGRAEVSQFLEHVARTDLRPLPALDAAGAALEFLYRAVLRQPLGELPLPRPPRLLDQVRQLLRLGRYALATEECYVRWITRFILYHGKRHPCDLGAAEVERFLTHLAVEGRVSASTQNQALGALLFLYAHYSFNVEQILALLRRAEGTTDSGGRRSPQSPLRLRSEIPPADNNYQQLFAHPKVKSGTKGVRRSVPLSAIITRCP